MEEVSKKLTAFFLRQRHVTEEEKEVYQYGFKLIIADVINFSIIILMSVIIHQVINGIAFLITLCLVRRYSGGFHAKSFFVCRLSLIITYLSVLLISFAINTTVYKTFIVFGIDLMSLITISILSPVVHPRKRLDQKQIKKNKIAAIITSSIFVVLSVLAINKNKSAGVVISVTLLAISFLMVIAKKYSKGGKQNV